MKILHEFNDLLPLENYQLILLSESNDFGMLKNFDWNSGQNSRQIRLKLKHTLIDVQM